MNAHVMNAHVIPYTRFRALPCALLLATNCSLIDLLSEHPFCLMDSPAPPPGQVRPTQVCKPMKPMKTIEQRPSKGMKPNENNPSLKQREDGSLHLTYSVKNDIAYQSYHERQRTIPIPSDFDMGGLKRSEWQQLLSCDNTIRTALTYNAETESSQRYYQLNRDRGRRLGAARQGYTGSGRAGRDRG